MERSWYWTVLRLQALRDLLADISEPTGEPDVRFIRGSQGLASRLWGAYREHVDGDADLVRVIKGMRYLTELGVLAPGRRGSKRPGYTRAFYPRVGITEASVRTLRQPR